MATLQQIADQLNAEVFILLFILGAAFWAVYAVTKFTTKRSMKQNESPLLMAEWNRDIPPIKERVDLIFRRLYPDQTDAQRHRSARITKTGEDIANAIQAQTFLAREEKALEALVEAHNPQNPYDLQQACFAVVEQNAVDLLPDESLSIAKEKALDYGIPLDNALAVIAVLLRDRILAKKGWKRGVSG